MSAILHEPNLIEEVREYLEEERSEVSDETVDCIRGSESCVRALLALAKKLNYRSKEEKFKRWLFLTARIRYKDGIYYETAAELLWDQELHDGKSYQEAKAEREQ